jgi:hypothetical protein
MAEAGPVAQRPQKPFWLSHILNNLPIVSVRGFASRSLLSLMETVLLANTRCSISAAMR